MNKLDKANIIVALLKNDPLVKSETVRIEQDKDYIQVEFYTKHDPEEDADASVMLLTNTLIERLGGVRVHMNDCEGCFNEGVVWFD